MSDNHDPAIPAERFFHCLDRARPADQQGDDIARKDDDVLERQEWVSSRERFVPRHENILSRNVVARNDNFRIRHTSAEAGADHLRAGVEILFSGCRRR